MTALHLAVLDLVDPDRTLPPFERNWLAEAALAEHLDAAADRLRQVGQSDTPDPEAVTRPEVVTGLLALDPSPAERANPTPDEVAEAARLAEDWGRQARAQLDAYRLARLSTIDPTAPAPGALMDPGRRRDHLARIACRQNHPHVPLAHRDGEVQE